MRMLVTMMLVMMGTDKEIMINGDDVMMMILQMIAFTIKGIRGIGDDGDMLIMKKMTLKMKMK